MRPAALLVLSLAFLCGCAARHRVPAAPAAVPPESAWRLEVGDGLFDGIVLLARRDDGLLAAVLDPSGVTLTRLRVDKAGRVTVNDGLARARGLARLVGRGLFRIFMESGFRSAGGCRRGGGRLRGHEVCGGDGRLTLDNPWPEPDLAFSRMNLGRTP